MSVTRKGVVLIEPSRLRLAPGSGRAPIRTRLVMGRSLAKCILDQLLVRCRAASSCSFVGAFDNAKEAEEHAKGCNDDDHGGLSYWTDEVDLETDGPNDFYISPEDLPKLDFPNLCKSAMVCKEWNAAVKGALVLLDTLCFSFELAK